MKKLTYTIKDELGIHARPAGLLVKAVSGYACAVKIATTKKEVDAKRIMGVMSLGVKCGDTITMTFDGADEDAAMEATKKFLEANV